MRIVATAVAIALSALWLSLVAFTSASRAQRSCLVFQGDVPLLDWNCLRTPARMALPYSGEGGAVMFEGSDPIPRADLCNPPLAMLIVRWLPKNDVAGWAFSALGLVSWLAAAGYFLRRRTGSVSPFEVAALAVSLPVFFAFHVGNVILPAAAAELVFLADYDAESRSRRRMAALLLAVAFAIKIAPVLLGVLYFGKGFRKRLPEAVLASVTGTLLILLPFAFYGGAAGFADWFENAAANAAVYAFRNPIGLCGVWTALGRNASEVHAYAVALSVGCLIAQGFARGIAKIALAVAGMLMLPPTMMIYTLSYFLPVVLALSASRCRRTSALAAVAFVFLSVPLQLFFGGFGLQPLLSAVGTLLAVAAAVPLTHHRCAAPSD